MYLSFVCNKKLNLSFTSVNLHNQSSNHDMLYY
uniref:Uncharacterized protein n=1 Tax=Arundo donax TaxID=35708 RepID=A0A0A8YQC1_ARUDO